MVQRGDERPPGASDPIAGCYFLLFFIAAEMPTEVNSWLWKVLLKSLRANGTSVSTGRHSSGRRQKARVTGLY